MTEVKDATTHDAAWYSRSTDDTTTAFDVDAERGLTTAEAAARLSRDGPNEITGARTVPAWRKFAEQFRDPLIYLLFAAIGISLLAWVVEGAEGVPFDSIAIAVMARIPKGLMPNSWPASMSRSKM